MAIWPELGQHFKGANCRLKIRDQSPPRPTELEANSRGREERNRQDARTGSHRAGSNWGGIVYCPRTEKRQHAPILCSQQKIQRGSREVSLSHSVFRWVHRLVERCDDFLGTGCEQRLLSCQSCKRIQILNSACVTSWIISVNSYAVWFEKRTGPISLCNGRHFVYSLLNALVSLLGWHRNNSRKARSTFQTRERRLYPAFAMLASLSYWRRAHSIPTASTKWVK